MNWSTPSTYAQTGVHHGYSTVKASHHRVLTVVGLQAPSIPTKGWYAKLDPGGFIVPHSDQGPWVERWHYPTEPAGFVWQSDTGVTRSPTDLFEMRHWLPHAVWNPDDTPRIHLIVEYDNPIDYPTADLTMYEMLPEIEALMAKVHEMTGV